MEMQKIENRSHTLKHTDDWRTRMELIRVQLLNSVHTLVERTVDGCSNGERATDHGTEADEEAGESLFADFTVDDLHGRDVLLEH
jgi:hypothetical protein